MMIVVSNVHVSVTVKNNVRGIVQCQVGWGPETSYCGSIHLPRSKTLNSMISSIGDVQIKISVHEDAPRVGQLT